MELTRKQEPADPGPIGSAPWEYSPNADTIIRAMVSAPNHYLAIRATGSTPAEGGPSFGIGSRSLPGIEYATGCARGFWPQAKSFDLIGSDAQYAVGPARQEKLPPGSALLKQAVVIAVLTLRTSK